MDKKRNTQQIGQGIYLSVTHRYIPCEVTSEREVILLIRREMNSSACVVLRGARGSTDLEAYGAITSASHHGGLETCLAHLRCFQTLCPPVVWRPTRGNFRTRTDWSKWRRAATKRVPKIRTSKTSLSISTARAMVAVSSSRHYTPRWGAVRWAQHRRSSQVSVGGASSPYEETYKTCASSALCFSTDTQDVYQNLPPLHRLLRTRRTCGSCLCSPAELRW